MNAPLPNFFIVGAQKAATTSLYHYLCQHPQIFLAPAKETHFFIMDERFEQGIGHYRDTYFSEWSGEPLVGEIDPDYMYFEEALDRISATLDIRDIRFVFVLRHPAERAYSHYLMTRRRGHEDLSFVDALAAENERLETGWFAREHYSYFSRGLYYRQAARFLRAIDRAQVHFVLFEDLRENPVPTLRDLFAFLGVDPAFLPTNLGTRFHGARKARSVSLLRWIRGPDSAAKRLLRFLVSSPRLRQKIRTNILAWNQVPVQNPALDAATREWLALQYASENMQLQELIQRDLSHWNS